MEYEWERALEQLGFKTITTLDEFYMDWYLSYLLDKNGLIEQTGSTKLFGELFF